MTKKVAVIGAGLTGCTIARILANEGHKVDLFEEDEVGGLCIDHRINDIPYQKYGTHCFHTNKKYIWDFVNRFAKFIPYELKVKAKIQDEIFDLPINLNTLSKLFKKKLTPLDAKKLINILKIEENKNPKNAEEEVTSRMGYKIYETFFRDYTIKQWQKHPLELDQSITARIPLRFNYDDRYFTDKYQGVPSIGFKYMFVNMIVHPLIKIHNKKAKVNKKFKNEYNYIIYTGRIDEYFNYIYGKLDYRCTRFTIEVIEGVKQYQEEKLITFPKEHEFTRITEYKHIFKDFDSKIWNKKCTIISKEYPLKNNAGKPLYPLLDEKNTNLLKKYNKLAKKEKKVMFIGRLSEFKYKNMDQSVEDAIDIARKVNACLK